MSVPPPVLSRALAAAALAGGLLVTAAPPASALPGVAPGAVVQAARPVPSTITVTGTGAASAAPDLAVVGMGAEATAPTTKAALAAQTKAAGAMLDAVRAQGVADRDIRTESLSLSPVHEYRDNVTKLVGYQAAQNFSVKVRDLDRTGAVVQAATDAAGDAGRIHSIAFDVADPTPLRAEARRAAHLDARAKAEQHAALSGRTLGRLVSVTEADSGRPSPLPMPPGAAADKPLPVAPGEVREEITLTAVYELD
ncbi:SIMPL domain-containing protein [Streptomyces sp. NPDC058657]|uniref:SIMPL domain-containing protein n=1 Tax=unclassified Streptomyces TaxID=2593676 RepID=UPI003661E1B1